MTLTSPLTLMLMYIINVVDLLSLLKCITKFKEIIFNTNQTSKWTHIAR